VTPDHGRATAGFKAAYWYVPPSSTAPCPFDTATFSWDGKAIASSAIDPTDCEATHEFAKPPTTAVGGHLLSVDACGIDPSTGGPYCPSNASIQQTYYVDPTPTLKLSRTSGLATTPFKATYKTGESECGGIYVQFYWDGKPFEAQVPVSGACSVTMSFPQAPKPNGVGKHRVTVKQCDGSCFTTGQAGATFTIKPPPTPRPTATPSPTPKPTPTPSPSPSPSPSLEPSVPPSDSPPPSAEPTGEVLEETSPPQIAPTPVPVAPVEPSPSPSGNPFVPALVSDLGGPGGGIDPAVVTTNLLLTLLLVFLFGLTAEIFNSTMDANRDEVHGWWRRLLAGPLAFATRINVTGAGLSRLAGTGRLGSVLRVFAILALSGLIYGFLSPDFGLNPQSLVLFISLVIGLGFITFYSEGSSSRLAKRRFRADASIRLYGTAVIVAIIAVIISRSISFSPGLVYGFIASAVIVAPVALAKRQDATLVLIPAFGLLVVSVLAYLLLGPVRILAAGGAPVPALLETILAMIMIGGLEGLFVTMIPLRFLDGATVMGWSRIAWALTFGTVTFLWWQLLFNQNAAYAAAFEQTNVQVVLLTLGVFMLTTGGLWSYFRFRPAPAEAEA
jgi:hypothetical protein